MVKHVRAGLSLVAREPRFHAGDDVQPGSEAAIEASLPGRREQILHRQRDTHVLALAAFDVLESPGGNADGGHCHTVDRDLSTHYAAVAAESLLPIRVAQYGDWMVHRAAVVIRREQSAHRGLDAKDVEVVA